MAASWDRLTGLGALRQAGEDHLSAERVRRAHLPLVERVRALAQLTESLRTLFAARPSDSAA